MHGETVEHFAKESLIFPLCLAILGDIASQRHNRSDLALCIKLWDHPPVK